MSDEELHAIPDQQKQVLLQRVTAGKDSLILWEEQFISIRNELNAVISTQKLFLGGIDDLKSKAAELVGDVPSKFGPQLQGHIDSANAGLAEANGFQETLKKMHEKVNRWQPRLGAEILRLSKEEITELSDLGTSLAGLTNLIETFAGYAKRMNDADKAAKAARTALAEAVRAACALATARLKTEKHAQVYSWIKTGISAVLGFIQLVDPTLVGESAAAGLKTVLLEATNAIKEAETRITAARTTLDGALGQLGPYTLCKGHLLGLGAAFEAALDAAHLLELVPVAGRALQFVVEGVSGVVKGFFKARIEEVDEMEKELTAKLHAIHMNTSAPTEQELADMKKEVAEAQAGANSEWGKIVGQLKGLVPEHKNEWVDLAVPAFKAVTDAAELAAKAVERVCETLTEIITTKVPHEMPKAVFAFEIKSTLDSLIVKLNGDFTDSEKAELAALQH